jgi:hypothetical protein
LKLADFARHIEDVNIDFKESIMKNMDVIKLKDMADLQQRVDEVKHEEQLACEKLHKEYMKREQLEQETLDKAADKKHLLNRFVAQWQTNKSKRALFNAWKNRIITKKKDAEEAEYFYHF